MRIFAGRIYQKRRQRFLGKEREIQAKFLEGRREKAGYSIRDTEGLGENVWILRNCQYSSRGPVQAKAGAGVVTKILKTGSQPSGKKGNSRRPR